MTVGFDTSILLSWYQAKANLASGGAGNGVAMTTAQQAALAKIPTAPWNGPGLTPSDSTLVTNALDGKPFVDEKAAKLDTANAPADYKRLFAINQGLVALQALANAANDPTTPSFQMSGIQQAFNRGMQEISKYVESTKFDEFRLTTGIATNSETSAVSAQNTPNDYVTARLATTSDQAVAAFNGTVQFNLSATAVGGAVHTVSFDFSEMGSQVRSMANVAAYMNGKLAAAGVSARVAVDRTDVPAQTMTVNGQPVTVTPEQSQYGFRISGLLSEALTFSAPTTAPAVYVAQAAGDPTLPSPTPAGTSATSTTPTTVDDRQQELVKFEAGAGADAALRPGDQNYAAGRVFSEKLPDGVTTVHATTTGADGSVYAIADGTGTVDGQPVKGKQDAVLLKYDSAGQLVYAQTLGAGVTASGLSLAVSSDGKVAIAGSVTGALNSGDAGADPTNSDSFVTVFDAKGQELWTQRQGATDSDQAQAVAFDASGGVYVAGQTKGSIGGQSSTGGWDSYLRAYDATGKTLATREFGSTGDDSVSGLLVNGNTVYVAGQDGTNGMVRSFDVTTPSQMTMTASRSLGSLGGGAVEAIGLDSSGNLLIGGATGANLGVGNTTLARGGGMDGFGARISADLTSTTQDAVAYYGGSGTDRATAATIAGGQVWLTGTTKTDLPGLTAVGKQDGFVAGLDVGAGQVTYSKRFTAKDQIDAPEAIAVDTSGGSALDRLGLPKTVIGTSSALSSSSSVADTTLLTTISSLRAGDQFQIRMGSSSVPTKISIDATDTLSTLADKIRRAGLFEINVSTQFNGTGTALSMKAANDRASFELISGPAGSDALAALGLKAGLVRNTIIDPNKGVLPADKGTQTYGMHLAGQLDLNSKADIKTALDSVGNAITTVRAIYADLRQAANPNARLKQNQGSVPVYLQNQIADYQAALDRLTGGGGGDSSSSSIVSLFG